MNLEQTTQQLKNSKMAQWFQANIRYTQQDDQGKQKTVNEVYLFDSVSYTDAEAKTYGFVAQNWPDFQLISIKRLKMQEVLIFYPTKRRKFLSY
jgi:hypothetical protein